MSPGILLTKNRSGANTFKFMGSPRQDGHAPDCARGADNCAGALAYVMGAGQRPAGARTPRLEGWLTEYERKAMHASLLAATD